MNCGRKALIEKGCYYNRPARELIFLTPAEHIRVHWIGKKHTKHSKEKMSKVQHGLRKGKSNWYNNGNVQVRAETCPDGFVRGRLTLMNWYNDGTRNIRAEKCPEGFVKGRLLSDRERDKCRKNMRKAIDAHRGKHHFTDGTVDVLAHEAPVGFVKGRPQKTNMEDKQ